jgi:hypothetical protein
VDIGSWLGKDLTKLLKAAALLGKGEDLASLIMPALVVEGCRGGIEGCPGHVAGSFLLKANFGGGGGDQFG